jgi:hypothetical protein
LAAFVEPAHARVQVFELGVSVKLYPACFNRVATVRSVMG